MTFYVYILQSLEHGSFYIGQTQNLDKRLKRHNQKGVKSTCAKAPWKLVYHETASSRSGATKREKQLKALKSRKAILKIIQNADKT